MINIICIRGCPLSVTVIHVQTIGCRFILILLIYLNVTSVVGIMLETWNVKVNWIQAVISVYLLYKNCSGRISWKNASLLFKTLKKLEIQQGKPAKTYSNVGLQKAAVSLQKWRFKTLASQDRFREMQLSVKPSTYPAGLTSMAREDGSLNWLCVTKRESA